ncbi:alanine dehydrogenase [Demequina aestuarii]|uniref:alanine dehydrogenase n=1 Tax=Demequina aestuarii TaxID=327095 RepID=UPI000782E3F3|nr:alanine dehydrogenase [Demequina aestuarii]
MRIGIPQETKNRETRVALTPEGARALVTEGHEVLVERGAGVAAFLPDAAYEAAGASIVSTTEAWGADLVLKVKEPVENEYGLLRGNVLFTFLHLAANEPLAAALVQAGTTAFSYDTVQAEDGSLPLLTPMSVIAGRLATLEGGHHLLSSQGGRGVLISGAPGVAGARVVVIGGGVAGSQALSQAVGMGADAVVIDLDEARLAELARAHGEAVRTVVSTPAAIEREVLAADLVIGAVLVPGHRAPTVVSRDTVLRMRPGAVMVDIAIDQGGCFEVSRPTTHDDPVLTVGEVQVYCVANMPGAVGATATAALTHATLPFITALAGGWQRAAAADTALARGLNTDAGTVRYPAVAQAFPHLPADLPAAGAEEPE